MNTGRKIFRPYEDFVFLLSQRKLIIVVLKFEAPAFIF